MSKTYTAHAVEELVAKIEACDSLSTKKEAILDFYKTHLSVEISKRYLKDVTHDYIGTLLFRLFIGINALVLLIIILFIYVDLTHHMNDAENRFISGGVLTTFMTSTVAQAFAGYFSFTKFINSKSQEP